jgi:spore coat protein U-like protein
MFLKSKFSKSLVASAVVGAAMFSAQSASAQTTTSAPLTVTATVQTACALDAATYSLPFNNVIIGGGGADKLAQVDVTVACGSPASYSLGASGLVGSRAMTGSGTAAGGNLAYELYRDAARSLVLGAVSTNMFTATASTGATYTIYGKVPQAGNATAPAGDYQDIVQLTLTF